MDLLDLEPELVQPGSWLSGGLPGAIVGLLSTQDLDTQEKALGAIRKLVAMQPGSRDAFAAHGAAATVAAVQVQLRAQLQAAAEDTADTQYHDYMASLCAEVLGLFGQRDEL